MAGQAGAGDALPPLISIKAPRENGSQQEPSAAGSLEAGVLTTRKDAPMSFLDKIVAAVAPPESEETRMQARQRARAEAVTGGWFELVLDHHEQIEQAFAAVKAAPDAAGRRAAQKGLAVILTGHANAEEAVLYPEMADGGHKTHAGMAYEEQAMTKIQLALLEKLEPMSQDYLDKLEHIRGAVTHHMYQEESDWFLELQSEIPGSRQAHLAQRFREEMDRYVGGDGAAVSSPSPTFAA